MIIKNQINQHQKKGAARHTTRWISSTLMILYVIVSSGSVLGLNLPSWVQSNGLLSGPNTYDTPMGIAVNTSGYVYVCDGGNNRIQIYTPSGQFLTMWGKNSGDGSYGSVNGEFHYPAGIAINGSGCVYVADATNYRIQVFTAAGQFLFKWNRTDGGSGTGNGEFAQVHGIAINSTGHVYVADTFNNRIQVFYANGTFITKWGRNGGDGSYGGGNGEFHLPTSVAFNAAGKVYVTDSSNNRVQVFSPSGQYLTEWGGFTGTYGPNGIVFNSSDYAYVTDSADQVKIFDPSGVLCSTWFLDGSSFPYGIALNATQHVFVTEYWRDRVEIFSLKKANTNGDGDTLPPEVIAAIVIVCVGAAAGIGIYWFLKKKAGRKGNNQ